MTAFLRGSALAFVVTLAPLTPGLAQEQVWLQIEAQPNRAKAEERARAYEAVFPNVAGFALESGWFGVALGPFASEEEAAAQARLLKGEGMIPSDAFVPETADLGGQFWPAGQDAAAEAAPPAPEAAPEPAPVAEAAPMTEETPAEARAAEAALDLDARKAVQDALAWEGVYSGAIDGAIGPGTRKAMAAWQEAQGLEATGTLTTAQRTQLLDKVAADRAELGLAPVSDPEAGIDIMLPLNLVQFSRYEHPFAIYEEKGGSGLEVLLISRTGDRAALAALYDLMQTLEVVPLDGERALTASGFTLAGANGRVASQTEVTLKGGLIKGYTLVWKPEAADRATRVLAAMRGSFTPTGDQALSEALSQPSTIATEDLLKGVAVRKPALARSGFYVDAAGSVLTTTEAIDACDRITLDGGIEARVAARDDAQGLGLLTPATPLAPPAFAQFRDTKGRSGAEIAVTGYSYAEALTAPVATFGTLADPRGLNGEADMTRLTLSALPGDAGGPVLDTTGAVLGMLLPAPTPAGKVLPADVAVARDAAAILALMAGAGLTPTPATATGALPAEDIAAAGSAMTVRVSCWK